MKELMLAIKNCLQGIPGIRDKDVFLSPDPDIIHGKKTFPCIGIKDGRIERSELSGGITELTLPVEIYVYEKLIQDEKAILSILDLTAAIHGKLQENYLADYVKEVSPGQESPVQLLYRKNGLILRKRINYEYQREEA